MELMGIKDTQFLLVRHFDNGNPHCHLVYNRINNEGKTITDQNDFKRNKQVTKLLKRKYGLTFVRLPQWLPSLLCPWIILCFWILRIPFLIHQPDTRRCGNAYRQHPR